MTASRLVLRVILTLGLLAVPLSAGAQPAGTLPRVGYLASFSGATRTPTGTPRTDFERTLRDLGWVNGQNVIIEFRFAEGRLDRLPALADEVLVLKVDVVYAADPFAIRAVATATRTVPIVGYDLETDSVEAGWFLSPTRLRCWSAAPASVAGHPVLVYDRRAMTRAGRGNDQQAGPWAC